MADSEREELELDMNLKNAAQSIPVPCGDCTSPSEKAEVAFRACNFIGCVNKFACGTSKIVA